MNLQVEHDLQADEVLQGAFGENFETKAGGMCWRQEPHVQGLCQPLARPVIEPWPSKAERAHQGCMQKSSDLIGTETVQTTIS